MGYTKFGKIVRKLMIDNDNNLGDVAMLMGVSSAFVSSVLTGKKNIPESWYNTICTNYSLDDKSKEELYNAYCEEKNSVCIDVEDMPLESKKLAIQFQRSFPTLSEEKLQEIWVIIGKK